MTLLCNGMLRPASWTWIAIVAVANAAPWQPTATGSDRGPNFIVILADDMGYGDASIYDGWIETPGLERMANEGLRFTDFHSSGVVCSPTRAGLLTGRYQQRAGIPGVVYTDPGQPQHYHGLQDAEITYPELLREQGYKTALFGKWHLGYAAAHNPMRHGFDRFRGFVSGNIDYLSHFNNREAHDWWEGTNRIKEFGYLTHLITQHSVEYIAAHREVPFCLVVAHGAVHTPIQAADSPVQRGPGKRGRDPRPRDAVTQDMMRALDESVQAILEATRAADIADRTLVVFCSDNGGARHMRNTPLRGGKGSHFEGGHRVPAVAWWPGRIKPANVTDQLAMSFDLAPTFLELAGVELPPGHRLDGVSLTRVFDGKRLPPRQLFWNGIAMRDGPWKLLTRGNKSDGPGPLLYNLDTDLGETRNVAADHPERVHEMLAAVETWRRDVAAGATIQPGPP